MTYHEEHQVEDQPSMALGPPLRRLGRAQARNDDPNGPPLADPLQELLSNWADRLGLPREEQGMPSSFMDTLERVPKSSLGGDEECPVCASAYLEDPYPLVVALPCPGHHQFDLECIAKWLGAHTTCPICRYDLQKPKQVEVSVPIQAGVHLEVEEDEEYYSMFG